MNNYLSLPLFVASPSVIGETLCINAKEVIWTLMLEH